MKNLILLLVFITGANFTLVAQEKAATQNSKKQVTRKDDNCMLHADYNKPLTVKSDIKNKVSEKHLQSDYVQFNEDGSYIQNFNGTESRGTWKYEDATKQIHVECNGTRTYSLNQTSTGYELISSDQKLQIGK